MSIEQKTQEQKRGMSRRSFLKLLGSAAIGAVGFQALPGFRGKASGAEGERPAAVEQQKKSLLERLKKVAVADLRSSGEAPVITVYDKGEGKELLENQELSPVSQSIITGFESAEKILEEKNIEVTGVEVVLQGILGEEVPGKISTATPIPPQEGKSVPFLLSFAGGGIAFDNTGRGRYYGNEEPLNAIGITRNEEITNKFYIFPKQSNLFLADIETGKVFAKGVPEDKGIIWEMDAKDWERSDADKWFIRAENEIKQEDKSEKYFLRAEWEKGQSPVLLAVDQTSKLKEGDKMVLDEFGFNKDYKVQDDKGNWLNGPQALQFQVRQALDVAAADQGKDGMITIQGVTKDSKGFYQRKEITFPQTIPVVIVYGSYNNMSEDESVWTGVQAKCTYELKNGALHIRVDNMVRSEDLAKEWFRKTAFIDSLIKYALIDLPLAKHSKDKGSGDFVTDWKAYSKLAEEKGINPWVSLHPTIERPDIKSKANSGEGNIFNLKLHVS